jgi:Transglycosylase-like domain
MQLAGARPHRAEPGALARPTKGGAVRIRIALTTALAVIAGLTIGLMTLSTRHPASAQGTARIGTPIAPVHISKSAMARFAVPTSVPVVTTTTTTPPLPPTTTTTTPTPRLSLPRIVTAPATTTAPPAVAPVAPVVVSDATSVATADWSCIRMHESGDRYNSASAPSGAYGILISTWRSFGLSGWPYEAPASEQDQIALELYARDGFQPWSSRYACGL